MSRPKKTVALGAVSEFGTLRLEIQADKIHQFPVIIASLLYMRGLLPMDAFGQRILREKRFHERYLYFVKGKASGNFACNRTEYVPICVFERHMSGEADQFLDLLLTVITDKSSPNKGLEPYTFTFDNSGERGTADRLTNGSRMDLISPNDERARMRNMIFEGKTLLRRLSTMCAESPALPDERSLGIHVFYKPECPGSYNIPGLTGSQDDTIEYPRTSYWKRTRRFHGSIDSGFHTVGLRVNSLLSTSPDGEAHFPSVEEANFIAVLRSDEVGIPTPAQMLLDVVEKIYVSTDGSTSTNTYDAVIPEKELKELSYTPARHQDGGDTFSKPTVTARTVDYVQNRHDATEKLDEENKDN
ncbi:DNA-binding HORMA [Penicillium fimorum]|uniref:DNA-binding HORMA n=1 Tax=Penicillium fimorum TaxID=1882269 RepID=A0A9W9XV62_9EURO|nr:DNA-binding HORMA [Penicillium fimorum]